MQNSTSTAINATIEGFEIETERQDDRCTIWINDQLVGIVTRVEVDGFYWCVCNSPLELIFSSSEEAIKWCIARWQASQSTPMPCPTPTPSPSPSPSPSPKKTSKPDMAGYNASPLPGDNVLVAGPAGQQYLVTFGFKITCTCPAGVRGRKCKHIDFAAPCRKKSARSEKYPHILVMLRHNDEDYALKGFGSPSRTAWRVLDTTIQQEIGVIYCWTRTPGEANFSVQPMGAARPTGIAVRPDAVLDDCIDSLLALREAEQCKGRLPTV